MHEHDNDNSEPCLSDFDQKRLESAMVLARHLPEDVRKIMMLTILHETLNTEIESTTKDYDCIKKKINDDNSPILKVMKKMINSLIVRSNAFALVISNEFK